MARTKATVRRLPPAAPQGRNGQVVRRINAQRKSINFSGKR